MNITDLIGKRVLMVSKSTYLSTVEEVRFLEVSPSGQWTKVMNSCGRKFWKLTSEIAVAEVLVSEPRPKE